MNLEIALNVKTIRRITDFFERINVIRAVLAIALLLAAISTLISFHYDLIVAYGDSESHLNIAKRVIHSITPGFAQLGGIWLPMPHIMMIPFVSIDFLWRTGLAGSIVSGFCYVVSSIILFKLAYLLTKSRLASFVAFLVFALNPNILYLQSTPMTELTLITFFLLSSYFFIRYIRNQSSVASLMLAALFGFCAVLSRYDGWFLVLFEAFVIFILHFKRKEEWAKTEGKLILFCTLAFFGIVIWMAWDFLILGDPFYFTNSQFSARTQQQNWLAKGELPAYHHLPLAVAYYLVTSMSNAGIIVFLIAVIGFFLYLKNHSDGNKYLIGFILLIPFIFNVFTLFVGQSVIFIPHLTPVGFEWRLFNVRYGVLMIPVIALFFGYAFYQASKLNIKLLLVIFFILQFGLYAIGYSKVISLADGVEGLSRARRPDAEVWFKGHYDHGLVLIDDYARTQSIIRSEIPMQDVIYIGNKPYWEESLVAPERYARWIIMQKDDDVWKAIYDKPDVQARLFKYFQKTYTSPQILIFRRNY